jgi:CRISPR-associated protein Cas5d
VFRILVEADYAMFTRPEMKVERVTYPVPTPSALEGMLKSVYWKPSMRYVIDKIVVFNPILYTSIRRNEVREKIELKNVKKQMCGKDADPVIYTKDCISQRTSLMLKNVKYGVEFHFELTNIRNEREENGNAKHAEIIKRRLERGQCFRQPCMGCRELAVKSITLVDDFDYTAVDSSLLNTQDLGYMLYGLTFDDDEKLKETWSEQYFSDSAEASFYHPFMVNGVIDVQKCRRGEYDFI